MYVCNHINLLTIQTFDLDTDVSESLMHSFRAGDENAFASLYALYYVRMVNHARRKINIFSIAEDLVHDVFIYLHEHRDIQTNPEAYLFKALRNRIYDYWRHQLVKGRVEESLFQQMTPYSADELTALELSEAEANITNAINQLPEQCRKVFLMSRKDELTYKEIAERLGISVKTVEAHISKALKYLREHLDYQLFWILVFECWMR
ncbi:MAG: RNA polymerase sigma-70 factor [Arachidicoccus sp.]|nr:RNA polymerase sigma-70 factor [Arachidicoccus sp.]